MVEDECLEAVLEYNNPADLEDPPSTEKKKSFDIDSIALFGSPSTRAALVA